MILPPPQPVQYERPRAFVFFAQFWLVRRCDKLVCASPNFPSLGPWEGQDWNDVMKLAQHEIISVVNNCRNLKQPIPFVENNRPAPRGCDVKRLGFL